MRHPERKKSMASPPETLDKRSIPQLPSLLCLCPGCPWSPGREALKFFLSLLFWPSRGRSKKRHELTRDPPSLTGVDVHHRVWGSHHRCLQAFRYTAQKVTSEAPSCRCERRSLIPRWSPTKPLSSNQQPCGFSGTRDGKTPKQGQQGNVCMAVRVPDLAAGTPERRLRVGAI
jgi:hypothetical protein